MLIAPWIFVVIRPLQVFEEFLVWPVRPFTLFGQVEVGRSPRISAREILMVRRVASIGARETGHGQRGRGRAESFQHLWDPLELFFVNEAAWRSKQPGGLQTSIIHAGPRDGASSCSRTPGETIRGIATSTHGSAQTPWSVRSWRQRSSQRRWRASIRQDAPSKRQNFLVLPRPSECENQLPLTGRMCSDNSRPLAHHHFDEADEYGRNRQAKHDRLHPQQQVSKLIVVVCRIEPVHQREDDESCPKQPP